MVEGGARVSQVKTVNCSLVHQQFQVTGTVLHGCPRHRGIFSTCSSERICNFSVCESQRRYSVKENVVTFSWSRTDGLEEQ